MLILVPTAPEAAALLEGDIPVGERPVRSRLAGRDVDAALVGFGPVAAGVLAARALETARTREVLLLGIAGTLRPEEAPVGSVVRAKEVRLDGVGRGCGVDWLGPRGLDLPQVPKRRGRRAVVDRLALPERPVRGTRAGEVLTVVSAAASAEMAAERVRRYPDALIEEMEGFAVALACELRGIGLTILRGVSNVAGDTERGSWWIGGALEAVRDAAAAWMDPGSP